MLVQSMLVIILSLVFQMFSAMSQRFNKKMKSSSLRCFQLLNLRVYYLLCTLDIVKNLVLCKH